ncbi:exodeoxyribonuclease V subunit alpha [Phycisphaera mikurensis]|uniref:Exodeoxyribonuclease V alpha chain n=1 Tax=Phycisphaera mikurensis (strain NBRC 102666 / KCTC 22515 / FYK2301M01) TaxID=1142394 RepID=I0ICH2_PHYMF|nr:exodeoxyribonuclease V subunit alpha [Phycisphaera mikurensis]MBB6442164.1 exodeoxyribonuclease V alpha subunit [Phycisphaera mikurensis]BAM02960.1 exodeoxyribonuclease V alpha chain [Phycisphaera mikurensis NBRC 102666]
MSPFSAPSPTPQGAWHPDAGEASPRERAVAASVERAAVDAGDAPEIAAAAGRLAAAVVAAEARGSTCVSLADLPPGAVSTAPDASRMIAHRNDQDRSPVRDRPLVLDADAGLLFTARSWFFQERLAANLAARLGEAEAPPGDTLARLFPDAGTPEGADAAAAAAGLAASRFGVLTGGPGTGKTTAAARLLAAFLLAEEAAGRDLAGLRIVLATPTGKAAERLTASIRGSAPKLDAPEAVRGRLASLEASTVHRLLGWTPLPPERGGPFRRTAENPLAADVVLVDEASMIGLELMSRLCDAVRPDARLILMGDANQLASVEAGGVLAELVTAGEAAGPLAGRVFHLRHSRRFAPGGAIDRLARAVLAGDDDAALAQLRSADRDALATFTPAVRGLDSEAIDLLQQDDREAASLGEAEAFRLRIAGVRVLTALRDGPSGEAGLNQRLLGATAPGARTEQPSTWPAGCPVLVTRNDPETGLSNGDLGLLERPDGRPPEVAFEAAEGLRRVALALIPGARPGHAMTVHKAQGSEAHRVFVVLPDRDTEVLSRELLYTALTRVADRGGERGRLSILGPEAVLRAAIRRKGLRRGGLVAALSAAPP